MNKKVLIMAGISALAGVGLAVLSGPKRQPGAEAVFPEEKLKGRATNLQIKILEGERVKSSASGKPLMAWVIAPFGIKPEQISPTGYGALKTLRGQYPDEDWICLFLAEDSAMAEASNWIGAAQYRKGTIRITGGFPSPAQLDSLDKIGQALHRPALNEVKITAALFDSSRTLAADRWELSQSLLGAGQGRIDKTRFMELDMETTALHSAAKSLGISPDEALKTALNVCRYYWLNAGEAL